MNELTAVHPLTVTASKEDIRAAFESVDGIEKVFTEVYGDKGELDFLDFTSMGLSVACILNEKFRVEDHKKFVKIYNQLLNEKFSSSLSQIHHIFNLLAYNKGAFTMLRKPDFVAIDVTDVFDGREYKSEHELERVLFESLTNWDEGWSVKRQRRVGNGLSDITILKGQERLAIELKKGFAQRKDVYQTLEYTSGDSGYLGVLIASGFDESVIQLADQLGINCYEYQLGIPSDGVVPQSIYLQPMNNAREKTRIELEIEDINSCDGHIIDFLNPRDSEKTRALVQEYHKKILEGIKELAELYQQKLEKKRCECCGSFLQK